MMGEGYEQLINAIIRPPRAEYDPRDMGPKDFQISGFKFERVDLVLKNERGMKLECSWWKPKKFKAKTLPCVVCLHGNASCRLVAMDNLNALLTTGITVFAFDFDFVFVFEDFADLVGFFSFFKGVSVDTGLLNRIDFSLPRNLEIIAMYK